MSWLGLITLLALEPLCPNAAPRGRGAPVRGWEASAPTPAPSAVKLNLEAAALYRQRKYGEAAVLYRAADAADPAFLAPRLNLAGLLVRRDDLASAANTLAALLQDGFVPWHAQAREATDLAALWARATDFHLDEAVSAARRSWAERVSQGVLMVSRLRAPIRLAPQDGPLPLFPQQEVVSWIPASGRFHQVTFTHGRVLALTQRSDGGEALFVTAEKVHRRQGRLTHFDGVRVHVLTPATLHDEVHPVAGPVAEVELGFDERGRAIVRAFDLQGVALPSSLSKAPERAGRRRGLTAAVRLSPAGVPPSKRSWQRGPCGLRLQDAPSPGTQGRELAEVWVRPRKGGPVSLPTPFGLGLTGLPLAGLEASQPAAP